MSDINYRDLLKRYMAGVVQTEGISFADMCHVETDSEKAELAAIEAEVTADNPSRSGRFW